MLLARFPAHGWRYSWFILGALTFAFAVTAFIFIRNNPQSKGLSPIGAVDNEINTKAIDRSKIDWSIILKTPIVWHFALIYVLFGFSYIVYMTFYSRYLSGEAGFSREQSGLYLALIGGFSIASGLLWGWVSDRIGRHRGLAIVFAIQAFSFIIFGIWKDPIGVIVSSVLFALTAWSIPAIMAATTGDLLGPKLAPATLGFITFFFGIGQVLGPFIGGRIFQTVGSFGPVFILAGIAAGIGAAASLLIGKQKLTQYN